MLHQISGKRLFRSLGVTMLCVLLSVGLIVNPAYAAPPSAPSVTTGAETVTISNYVSGATLKIYRADSGSPVWQESNVTTATSTVSLLPYASYYYATQTVGGEESTNTPFFNTTLRTPVAAGGIRFIDVTNVSGNTTLELHRVSNGSLISTTVSNQGGGVYRFQNVIPDSSLYYVVQSYGGQTSSNTAFVTSRLNTPIATGGAEYVDVTNVDTDIGAALSLHASNGTLISNSSINQGNGIFRFSNIPPGSDYYATQSLNGVEASSNQVNVSADLPIAPVLAAANESLEVSGIVPGADLTLYTTLGTFVNNWSNIPTSTYTLENVLPNTIGYYVTQSVNGKESVNSNFANPTLHIPTATAGIGYIEVTDVTNGATLNLYDASNGQLQPMTAVDQGSGTYRFENVVPRSGYYYVTQSLGGRESLNTPFVNSLLPTPVLTSGINYVEVSNVYNGADLVLYHDTTPVSSTPESIGNGLYRFDDLDEDTPYYVVQSINGVLSPPSNIVQVTKVIPPAPSLNGVEEAIEVSNYAPGAKLTLYRADGTLIRSADTVTDSVYTFEDILPHPLYYYVTQTVDGKESLNSVFTNPTLRTPAVEARVESIDVRNVSPRSTLKLYDAGSNTVVSSTYTLLDNGDYRFADLEPRASFYYVTQSANGIESTNSLFINPILRTPIATGGLESVTVDNVYPGAVLKLFRSSSLQALKLEPIAIGDGKYRFDGIGSAGTYEVVQYVNDVPSPRSNTVNVSVRNANGSGGNETSPTFPNPPVAQTPQSSVDVLVNGQVQKAGTLTESLQGNRKVQTILVNPELIRALLATSGNGATVTVPFADASNADIFVGQLSSALIQEMNRRAATLVIETPIGLYRLPTAELPITANDLSDDTIFSISIAKASDSDTATISRLSTQNQLNLLQSPVTFEIAKVTANNRTTVERFKRYVERMIPIQQNSNTDAAVTGVVLANDSLVPVPTRFVQQNGRNYAVLSSLTNSTYALVSRTSELTDISGSWAADAIDRMNSRLIVEGTGSGLFEPSRLITRAEFASILTKGLGLKPSPTPSTFRDVSESAWYQDAVTAAAEYDLVTGFTDGTFRPQQQITRAEAIVMLSRALELTGSGNINAEATLQPFVDRDDLPSWAQNAALTTVQSGLLNGQNGNRLAPQQPVSRAEVATLIDRLLRQSGLIEG